ncbi:MAG: efflux RND transporter periplasmic adaptor subunit, partial [Gemmatimonadota bacterium]
TPYRLVSVDRGDVEETVAATGTLAAVQTVAIGTQVSGRVIELTADFNDNVEAGQLLARIDPTLQQQQVRNAEARLDRARADLKRTEEEFERNRILYEQQVITDSEFSQIEYSLTVARSNVTSAEIDLEQARQNLDYTQIYAPIEGVVIERNAEVGQTVAASLSTPQLFLLANDLTQLEILASVDESDIGMIEPGQPVRFTVQAYREETFDGVVRQVRLQSANTENVVNYTVVITVDNPDLRLLPGMTAVVDFIVQRAEDVYKVSNAALRFTPTPEMLAQLSDSAMFGGGAAGQRAGRGQGAGGEAAGGADRQAMIAQRMQQGGGAPGAMRAGGQRQNLAMLWYLQNGQPAVMRVQTGISDGVETAIEAPDLEPGMQVIAGMNTAQTDNRTQTSNPFQQGGGGGGVRMRGGF